MAVANVGTVANKGAESSQGSSINMGFSDFLHFSLCLEASATLATMALHASSRWSFSHVDQLEDCILPAINIRKWIWGVWIPLHPLQKLY
jgi:hypothetical protein